MTSHLTLPWTWVECPENDTCRSIAHLDETPDLLNSYPKEWVLSMLDRCIAEDDYFAWVNADDEIHCVTGPAVMASGGQLIWRENGFRHRIGGPADEKPGRFERWMEGGSPHRVGAPAMLKKGEEKWYVKGSQHRLDGPAVTVDGEKMEWYQKGLRHRDGGKPAVIHADGYKEWWLKDKKVSASSNPAIAFFKETAMKIERFFRVTTERYITIRCEYKMRLELESLKSEE